MERLRMGKRGWRRPEEKGMEYRLIVERVYLEHELVMATFMTL